jgi:hypothetical protein
MICWSEDIVDWCLLERVNLAVATICWRGAVRMDEVIKREALRAMGENDIAEKG